MSRGKPGQGGVAWNAAGEIEVLMFELRAEPFALEAAVVQEILDLVPTTRVPGAPPIVGGVINFRGKVIPVADLRLAFAMDAEAATIDSRIIVVEIPIEGEATQVGLLTDKVCEVTTLKRDASESAPGVGLRWRPDYIRRLVRRDGRIVVLPDLAAILRPQSDLTGAGHPPAGPTRP